MGKTALLVFVKNNEPGKVKTRLAKSVGNTAAAAVYSWLLNHTKQVATSFAGDLFVFYNNFIEKETWRGTNIEAGVQINGNLGEKMSNAIQRVFSHSNYESVIIIGSDCSEISAWHLQKATDLLQDHDVVIGPAEDGGYYLLGMNKYQEFLFVNKDWSTKELLQQTLHDITNHNLTVELLPTLRDIDYVEDLEACGLAYLLNEHSS